MPLEKTLIDPGKKLSPTVIQTRGLTERHEHKLEMPTRKL